MLNDTAYYGFRKEENTVHDRYDDILHCIVVGFIIFTASCGCVTGILSEFDISVNYVAIIPVLFAASMFLSLIHLSRLLYVAGYFSFLFAFAYGLLSLRTYANSGYQALLNIINKTYSDHYLLPSVREYNEIISDRYVTITTVSIFLGLFLVLLLNVGIFNDMFFFTTFNLTFWPLQLGIFIGRYPSYTSLALLFFSYFSVYFLRHSGHFHFVQPKSGGKPREYAFEYDDRMNRNMIFQKSNARSMLALCAFALIVSLTFGIFCSFAVRTSENEALLNRSSLKARLDENIKILTQSGIAGMFNRYQATGGISGGKLGGVRSVTPDYETDLKATFVPYSFETLYLHAFTGQQYTGSKWNPPSAATGYALNMPGAGGPSSQSAIAGERILSEARTLSGLMDRNILEKHTARMTVENIDADTSYIYTPYFLSDIPEKALVEPYSSLSGFFAKDSKETYEFIPYSSNQLISLSSDPVLIKEAYSGDDLSGYSEYETEIYDNYLQIPASIRDELISYHEKIGTSDKLDEQIRMIYDFFLDNYVYDMAPGATPMGSDFVTYFLSDQKRGYCAHFASAGVMLLRSYGIPARYAEGYVITTEGVTETASGTDEDASYYYTGDNPLGRSSVITTEISDGNAHAWAEVYIPDFGWFPVEFTVPSTDNGRGAYADFLSALGRLFRPSNDIEDQDTDNTQDSDTGRSDSRKLPDIGKTPVFVVFLTVLLIFMLIPPFKKLLLMIRRYMEQKRSYRSGDYSSSVAYRYTMAARRLAKKYKRPISEPVRDNFILIENMLSGTDSGNNRLRSLLDSHDMSLEDIQMLTLTCFYSEKKISRSEADLLIKFYKNVRL